MPELPEVEVLVRHLRPLLQGRTIGGVTVRRAKVIAPTAVGSFGQALRGARFLTLERRGKYLLFGLRKRGTREPLSLLGHLGMTGRMYLLPAGHALPKHAAVVLNLGKQNFIFEDTRYFGRLTLDTSPAERLGPEPLDDGFTAGHLAAGLRRSRQAVKVKLLDQGLLAGVGNIYASEALFRARIPPGRAAGRLTASEIQRLWRAVRAVLREAVACGSTVPLNFDGRDGRDGLFYFGRAAGASDYYEERLRVYDRAGRPCVECGTEIRRRVQAARSTYYCPQCQQA